MAHIPREPIDERLFAGALASSEPFGALRKLAEASVARGVPQAELLAAFDQQLQRQANNPDESLYDAIADVMDLIVGWCSPEAFLYKLDTEREDGA